MSKDNGDSVLSVIVIGIAGGISMFFAAFLIDVFTDMHHYLQSGNSTLAEMNAKLTGLATGQASAEITQDGPVVAWGNNGNGQTTVPAGLSGVVAIAAGELHTVALKQDGTVVAWGDNHSGQTTVPAGLSGVVAIAAGGYHTVALKQDGTVVAWGHNDEGQTTVPAGLSGVVAIAAGYAHTVALRLD